MKKRSDGRFCRKIKINNKFVFFYSSEATEKQAARDIEQQLIQYRDKEKNGKLFAEAAKEWSEYHFPTLEHNSLKQYRPAFHELVEQFGEFYIKNITSNQIDLFLKNYAKRGYAQKTVKTRLLVMN